MLTAPLSEPDHGHGGSASKRPVDAAGPAAAMDGPSKFRGVADHVDEYTRWSPSADSAMLCPELLPVRSRSRLGFFRLGNRHRMTREDFHEQGVLIKRDGLSLYGLLRTPPGSRRLAVLVPWGYGDRTGMTRIYVEAARRLYRAGVASLCIDTPPNNYSRDSQARRGRVAGASPIHRALHLAHGV